MAQLARFNRRQRGHHGYVSFLEFVAHRVHLLGLRLVLSS
jgi:hypothetical protein